MSSDTLVDRHSVAVIEVDGPLFVQETVANPRPSRRRRMSQVDAAWLRMESPTNLMMITGVMLFSEPLSAAALNRILEERFLQFPRFRLCAVDEGGNCFWDEDPDFELENHVRHSGLPGHAGQQELQQFASELASEPLPSAHPRWQFHLIEDYQGGSALIMRIHHCYADGIALVQVMSRLTDDAARASPSNPRPGSPPANATGFLSRFTDPAIQAVDQAVRLGTRTWGEFVAAASHPDRTGRQLREYARQGGDMAKELAHLLAMASDPESSLRGQLGTRKSLAWCQPLSLNDVKAASAGLGCTVNDVLVAAVCGALSSYLSDQGEDLDGLEIRASVPVNLRPLDEALELGNRFGLVLLGLPLNETNPIRRLHRVRERMNALKSSSQAAVTYGLLAGMGMAPGAIHAPALEFLADKASAVLTNVPGPTTAMRIAGAEISQQMFWVPQTGNIGIGISILSYNGQVQFGLMCDRHRIPDSQQVIDRFAGEFETLLMIALLADWDQPVSSELADELLDG